MRGRGRLPATRGIRIWLQKRTAQASAGTAGVRIAKGWRQGPPLWPAGHLPLKGGDRTSRWLSPITNVE
ncbi:hypothetical protein EN742_28000 [Mesorhizobium sp. M4A.F.Ca.ET.020.02.1.1]|nr:hypothetical protein EN742_28000 [Mesorhizobium sp. M4A.F.Ca.ET.020.02.1.1]TIW54902.1 MAG: hypothetical protein E5V56_12315 [Mesorhizobium sp.]